MQLTNRKQYKKIIKLELCSIELLDVDFLNQVYYFSVNNYPTILMRLDEPVLELVSEKFPKWKYQGINL